MSKMPYIDPAGSGPPDPRKARGDAPAIAEKPAFSSRSSDGKPTGSEGADQPADTSGRFPRINRAAGAAGRLLGRSLGHLWRLAWAHPAPTFGASLAGLALLMLSLVPSANGYYTTGMNGTGDRLADLECLALNIYHEARGEPRYGKFAVGHVVINRTRDPRFPDDVCAVVKQGGEETLNGCQFSWWCDGKSDEPRDARAWLESKALASLVYSGRVMDPTGGALWYHADFVDPDWRSSLTEGHKIGRHIFYHPVSK